MAVTVTATPTGGAGNLLRVLVLTGATAAGGASAGPAGSTGGSLSLTPNGSNSYIVWSGDNEGSNGAYTAIANNAIVDNIATTGGTRMGTGNYTGTVTSGTPVTVGATAASSPATESVYEILASGGSTPSLDASSPAVVSHTSGTTACTTASFSPPAGSVIVAICTGGGFVTSWAVTDSGGGYTWTKRIDNGNGQVIYTATVPSSAGPAGTVQPLATRPVPRRPAQRARIGAAGLAAAGLLAQPVPAVHTQPAAGIHSTPGRGPSRARLGPRGLSGGGIAGPANAVPSFVAVGPPAWKPQPRPRPGQRALWRGVSGTVRVPGVAVAAPKQKTPPRRPPGARALWRGIAGSPPPPAVITVTSVGTGAGAVSSGFYFPFPGARPIQVAVTNTAGDWMIAVITWRQTAASEGVSVSVADDVHNYWEPLGAPSGDSSAAGVTRTAIWYAPAARAASFVQVAPTGTILAIAVRILDVSGMSPWGTLTAITPGFANASTALSLAVGSPASQALMVAGLGTDNNADTITGPGAGWTTLPALTASNGVDHTADIELNTAYRLATAGVTAAWSSSGSLDLSGVTAGILVTGTAPTQGNPEWPVIITEVAPGSGPGTAPSQIAWTPLTARKLAMQVTQGRQYTLGQLQAGQGTMQLDNPDGALIPPGTGAWAGIDSGTPVRTRWIIPASSTPFYVPFSGYFQRWPFNLDPAMLRGETAATIIDVWGYAGGSLNSMARQELLLDNPYALWTLADPVGSTSASNLAPGNQNPLTLVLSKLGAGGATQAFGANSGAFLGDTSAKITSSGTAGGGSTTWSQTLSGTSQNTNGYGYALVCYDPNYPPVSAGVTIEAWFEDTGSIAVGFSAVTSGNQFTCSAGYANGTPVTLSTAAGFTFPGGFSANTIYYVISASGNNFQLSSTIGGSAITVTSAGQGFIQATTPFKSVIWSARNAFGPVAELGISSTNGNLLLTYRPANASSNTTVTVSTATDYRGTGWRHIAVIFNQTSYQVIVDGGGLAGATGTFSSPIPAAFTEMDYGGIMSSRAAGPAQGYCWTGALGLLAIFPAQLTPIRVLNHYLSAQDGLAGEAACDRIERLLEYAGLTGRRCLLQQSVTYEGDLCVSGQDIGGQGAATSIQNVSASTLPAMMYVAPTGDLFYLAKLHAWDNPIKWVLGDNWAGGEIPFLPGFATDYDPARVVNDIQLTNLDSQYVTVPSALALEAASQAQYGDQPYQQTGYLEGDANRQYNFGGGLDDLADWIAYTYAKPRNRVQTVTVEAASYPAAQAFAAGVAVGDMVTCNLRPPTAAGLTVSVTGRVTQTTRVTQFSQDKPPSLAVTCVLDFAPEENALTCDDPVRGLLNGTNVLGW